MPTFKRDDTQKALQEIQKGKFASVYLVFGDRFLCQEVVTELIDKLRPDEQQRSQNVKVIDGGQEDFASILSQLRSFSLFPGRRIYRVTDSKILYSKDVSHDLWQKAQEAFAAKQVKRAANYIGGIFGMAGVSSDDWKGKDIVNFTSDTWKKVFGFTKPDDDISWLHNLLEEAGDAVELASQNRAGADVTEQFINVIEGGLPGQNILILQTDTVDKRKKLFKYLVKNAVVFDLAVDSGSTSAARKEQDGVIRQLINRTLTDFGKKIEPKVFAELANRVGFHPVAAVVETEKLAMSVGDAPVITIEDVEAIIGRTREDALYEINEFFGKGNLGGALQIVSRMLETGLHPLAILATLRNFVRKLFLVRSYIELTEPVYKKGMSFGSFQKGYLAELKELKGSLPTMLKGHPYALYNLFMQAERFTLASLKENLADILDAEYHLKSSAMQGQLVLENCLFRIIKKI